MYDAVRSMLVLPKAGAAKDRRGDAGDARDLRALPCVREGSAMKDNHPAKVALRTAAAAWAEGLTAPVVGSRDDGFRKLDNQLIKAAGKLASMAKRGYSRDFKPHGDTGKRYLLDQIPAGLWADVKTKAKREGVSIRALILQLLKEWAAK